jgi:hypothetical protein
MVRRKFWWGEQSHPKKVACHISLSEDYMRPQAMQPSYKHYNYVCNLLYAWDLNIRLDQAVFPIIRQAMNYMPM